MISNGIDLNDLFEAIADVSVDGDDASLISIDEAKAANDHIHRLEAAIRTHLEHEGYNTTDESLEWWIESRQPCEISTVNPNSEEVSQ